MRILFAVVLLSLTACRPKKPTEPAEPSGDPAVAVPRDLREPITECPGEPGWLAWAPCRAGETLYVSAKVSGPGAMAKSRAMNQARAELTRLGIGEATGDGEITLRNSEALDSFGCKEDTWGLARWTGDPPPDLDLTDCAGVNLLSEAADESSCPAWTRRGGWREGDALMAVGWVKGISNRSLASTAARNRAIAEAGKVRASIVRVSDTGVSLSAVSAGVAVPSGVEEAECDGVLYTKVQLLVNP